jgi:hypothetical protein
MSTSLKPRTRQKCDANARFSRVCFGNEALIAVLHLSEICDQQDVTLESSKIVKLAITWVAATRCNQIKIRWPRGKNKCFTALSLFRSSDLPHSHSYLDVSLLAAF